MDLDPDWESATERLVAGFRQSVGTDTDDQRFIDLVGELSLASPRFRALWARHDVREREGAELRLDHPQLGELRLHREKLAISGPSGRCSSFTMRARKAPMPKSSSSSTPSPRRRSRRHRTSRRRLQVRSPEDHPRTYRHFGPDPGLPDDHAWGEDALIIRGPNGVLFGVNLDWGHQQLSDYANTLGHHPAVAVSFADFPLTSEGRKNLQGATGQHGPAPPSS